MLRWPKWNHTTQRSRRRRGCNLGANADAVADRELDVASVQHRHLGVFAVVGVTPLRRPFAEDRRAVRCRDAEDRLVLLHRRHRLPVDEEQRDDPAVVPLADLTAHQYIGAFGIDGERTDRTDA